MAINFINQLVSKPWFSWTLYLRQKFILEKFMLELEGRMRPGQWNSQYKNVFLSWPQLHTICCLISEDLSKWLIKRISEGYAQGRKGRGFINWLWFPIGQALSPGGLSTSSSLFMSDCWMHSQRSHQREHQEVSGQQASLYLLQTSLSLSELLPEQGVE